MILLLNICTSSVVGIVVYFDYERVNEVPDLYQHRLHIIADIYLFDNILAQSVFDSRHKRCEGANLLQLGI